MAEQSKRDSQVDIGELVPSGKKPRAYGVPHGMVKQELPEGGRGRDEEQLERDDGQGVGAGAQVAIEVIRERQINNLRMGMALLHCRACILLLKPPTFKCEVGHVVCSTCRVSHGEACGSAAAYAACAEVDAFVRDAKVPCKFEEHGCASYVVYYQASDHQRACRWAPCYCPDPVCDAFTSPARLLKHFRAGHQSWPITDLPYGRTAKLAVPAPAPQGLHVLVGEADGSVFLVSSSALGRVILVSVVCVRANGDAAAGSAQYKCKLWMGETHDGGSMAWFPVASSKLPGGLPVAGQQGLYLPVPPMMPSGEEPVLKIFIDRTGGAAANSNPTPAAMPSG